MAAGRHGGYKDRVLSAADLAISRKKDYYQDRARSQDERDSGFIRLRDNKERISSNGAPDLRASIGNYSKTGELSNGSCRKKAENGSRDAENGNSAAPSKKRKFSPIIWDRDDGRNSVSNLSRSRNDENGKVVIAPLPPLPPSPLPLSKSEVPLASSNDAEPVFEKVSLPEVSEQQQRNIDQNARLMVEDMEGIVMQRGVSFSRWADTDTAVDDKDNEHLEHKVATRKINTPLNDLADNRLQRSAATPEVGVDSLSQGSGKAIGKPLDLEFDHCGDNDEFTANKLDPMDVDADASNDDGSSGRYVESDSEGEDARSETPERMQTPLRCINMLQGCRSVDEFERLNKIDEGTYGVVYRAKDKKFGEVVALKKVKMEKEREGFPLTSLREINILLSLHHPSIVDVKEVVVGRTLDSIFMVMEYMDHDLKGLMEAMKQPFSQSEVKCLMLQLFSGIKYLHDNWVLHRDLKTSNILLNNRGELKICDFGLSRQYGSPLKPYTHLVVTLWYRAPELLLGAKEYSTAIDMWSLGCIMAELLGKEPLFSGKTEFDQLDKIFRILGTPNEKIWPGFAKLPGVKVNFVKQPYNKLREKFPATSFSGRPTLSEAGFDLLNKLLTYDPEKRISAEAALRHDWFHEVPLPKSKEFMPTFPAQHAQDRRLRRIMKSPDPLAEQRKKELQQGELGFSGLFG